MRVAGRRRSRSVSRSASAGAAPGAPPQTTPKYSTVSPASSRRRADLEADETADAVADDAVRPVRLADPHPTHLVVGEVLDAPQRGRLAVDADRLDAEDRQCRVQSGGERLVQQVVATGRVYQPQRRLRSITGHAARRREPDERTVRPGCSGALTGWSTRPPSEACASGEGCGASNSADSGGRRRRCRVRCGSSAPRRATSGRRGRRSRRRVRRSDAEQLRPSGRHASDLGSAWRPRFARRTGGMPIVSADAPSRPSSARRSSLPVGVSGSSSITVTVAGTIDGGSWSAAWLRMAVGIERAPVDGDDRGGEATPGASSDDRGGGGGDAGGGRDDPVDLGELDAVATQLDLPIPAADELDPAVGETAADVAGAVAPIRRAEPSTERTPRPCVRDRRCSPPQHRGPR